MFAYYDQTHVLPVSTVSIVRLQVTLMI